MKKQELVLLLSLMFVLSGCVVRTYPLTKDRVDQNLSAGNLGYLQGRAPEAERQKERKTTRQTRVVEIELYPPIKFESAPKSRVEEERAAQRISDQDIWGNRGYISQGDAAQVSAPSEREPLVSMEQYTVKKGDTLQKISQRYYGTTKNWYKIFKANQDTLKGPDKIYPGQVINVPVESMKEIPEHLK